MFSQPLRTGRPRREQPKCVPWVENIWKLENRDTVSDATKEEANEAELQAKQDQPVELNEFDEAFRTESMIPMPQVQSISGLDVNAKSPSNLSLLSENGVSNPLCESQMSCNFLVARADQLMAHSYTGGLAIAHTHIFNLDTRAIMDGNSHRLRAKSLLQRSRSSGTAPGRLVWRTTLMSLGQLYAKGIGAPENGVELFGPFRVRYSRTRIR